MSLPIIQIKRRNKDTSEEYSTAQLLNGLIEGELGFNYFDKSLWIGPLGSSTGREYSVLVNSNHKLYDGSWVGGTTAGPVLSLRDYETRNSSFNSITLPSIPSASASASGVVTTGAQAFAGLKTFNNGIKNIGNFIFTNAAGTFSATFVGPGANVTFNMPDTGGTIVTHATKGTAVGSSSKPVYIATTGRATACSNYAGGTAVTLNGTSKSAASASFYAPTSGGTSGYLLKSGGSSAPTWIAQNEVLAGGLDVPLLTDTVDFNSYFNNTNIKFYSVSSGAVTTNGPVSNSGDRYSFYCARLSSTTGYQEAFSQIANKKYYRTSQNSTDWNAWQVAISMPAGTAIGSGTHPVYINSSGTPVATAYTLNATVPSNAAFTDEKVAQGKSTTANWRPVLSHNAYNSTYGADPGSAIGGVYYTPSIAIQPSTGTIRATKFIGEFEGNASSANGVTPEWAGSISNADARWVAAWTTDGKKIKALDKNTMTVLGASQATGSTFSIKNASGGNVDLVFDRGTNANWKVLSASGNLHFQCDYTSSKGGYYDVMRLYYDSGNAEIKGSIKVGGGCTLQYDSTQKSLKFIFS